jgi:hypothetical protein
MVDAHAATETWLRLLDTPLGAETAEWLASQRAPRELAAFGERANTVLMPAFVDAAECSAALSAAEQVLAAIKIGAARLRADVALRRHYRYAPRFDPLIDADRAPPRPVFPLRPDGYLDGRGGVKFFELNTIPGGFAASRRMSDLFLTAPILRHQALRGARFDGESPLASISSAIDSLRRADGGVCLGLVGRGEGDWEFPAQAALCTELGAEYVWAPPDEITVDRGRARFGNREVDHVVLGHPAKLGPEMASHPLMSSFLRGEPVSFLRGLGDSVLLGRKSMLALLTDEAFATSLPGELARAVRAHVPWTRVLEEQRTTDPAGQTVELLGYVRRAAEQLVLKPVSESGGAGVVLGWKASTSEWESAIQSGLTRPTVVQARVDGRTFPLPVWRDGRVEVEQRIVDFCPFLWGDGVARGVFTRSASDAGLTNVHGGGGVIGCLTVQ